MGSVETSDRIHTYLHFQEWDCKHQRKTQTLRVSGPLHSGANGLNPNLVDSNMNASVYMVQ